MAFGGEVFNFGVNNQSGVTLSMDMALDGNTISSGETGFTMYSVDGDGFYSVEETDGYIDADESVYFEMSMEYQVLKWVYIQMISQLHQMLK